MIAILNQSNKFLLVIIITIIITNKSASGIEAYFDLSDQEINIETDFNGKEVIIFGLTDPSFDTILVIKGPNKNVILSMKERLFGFWLETKKIIYQTLSKKSYSALKIREVYAPDGYQMIMGWVEIFKLM